MKLIYFDLPRVRCDFAVDLHKFSVVLNSIQNLSIIIRTHSLTMFAANSETCSKLFTLETKWIKPLRALQMENVVNKQFHKRLRMDSNIFVPSWLLYKLSFELFGRSIGVNYRLKCTVCWCQHNNTSYLGGVVSPTDSMDYVNDAELTMISISRLGRTLVRSLILLMWIVCIP